MKRFWGVIPLTLGVLVLLAMPSQLSDMDWFDGLVALFMFLGGCGTAIYIGLKMLFGSKEVN